MTDEELTAIENRHRACGCTSAANDDIDSLLAEVRRCRELLEPCASGAGCTNGLRFHDGPCSSESTEIQTLLYDQREIAFAHHQRHAEGTAHVCNRTCFASGYNAAFIACGGRAIPSKRP